MPELQESSDPVRSLLPARADIARRVLWGMAVAGIVCRLVQYLWDRSFWVDEASLVLNIRDKTALQLLGALDFHQAAPPLFLLAQRAAFVLLGGSEWAMRALPLVAGCAAVAIFARLAIRTVSRWAAVLAVGLFSFSDRLIWHSVEAKPYGSDVFFAVLLTLIAMPAPRPLTTEHGNRTDLSVRRLAVLCLVGALAIWFSYPAAFVVAGLSLAILPQMVRRRWRGLGAYALCHVPLLLSVAGLLLCVKAQHSQGLAEYWAEDFPPLGHPLLAVPWLGRHLLALCNYPIESAGVIVLPCALLGATWILRGGQTQRLAMLVNPIGMNLVAAAAMRYPFDGARLTVYLAPAVLLLASAGAIVLYGLLRRWLGPAAFAPAAVMLGIAAASAAFHLVVPRYRGHVRPAVAYVREHLKPHDGIYALEPRDFQCYWSFSDGGFSDHLPAADQISFHRFWIVWSYPNARVRRRLDPVLQWVRGFAAQKASYDGAGGCAFLFEVTARTPPHSGPPDMSTHHKMMSE